MRRWLGVPQALEYVSFMRANSGGRINASILGLHSGGAHDRDDGGLARDGGVDECGVGLIA